MKKVLFAVAFVAFATMSCKKDYTCDCTLDGEKLPSIEYEKVKKSDAEDTCDKTEADAKALGANMSCKLNS